MALVLVAGTVGAPRYRGVTPLCQFNAHAPHEVLFQLCSLAAFLRFHVIGSAIYLTSLNLLAAVGS